MSEKIICPFCHKSVEPIRTKSYRVITLSSIPCNIEMEWEQCPSCQTSLSNPVPTNQTLRAIFQEEREREEQKSKEESK